MNQMQELNVTELSQVEGGLPPVVVAILLGAAVFTYTSGAY